MRSHLYAIMLQILGGVTDGLRAGGANSTNATGDMAKGTFKKTDFEAGL